ncbi:MAG: hypothetical protein M1825_002189 [Sarcosagium campestre]|nr:MAG: hypothetical protein M1825_002189 [Sarcosagium campestre]
MLLPRLCATRIPCPPSHLLGTISSRRLASNDNIPTPAAEDRHGKPKPAEPSLLEKLFPEESAPTGLRRKDAQSDEREMPRLVFSMTGETWRARTKDAPKHDSPRFKSTYGPRGIPTRPTTRKAALVQAYVDASRSDTPEGLETASARLPERKQTHSGNKPASPGRVQTTTAQDSRVGAVLVLQKASPFLSESDFRRVVPSGWHLAGWKSTGDITQIIPRRDPQTMAATGDYFILFPSTAAAQAYLEHVTHLHRLAHAHTPTSIESPLVPPPGYVVDGLDVHRVLQSYTLLPPSQPLRIKLLTPPFSRHLQALIARGGYETVSESKPLGKTAVLAVFGDLQPSERAIRDLVVRNEKRNNSRDWETLRDRLTITRLEAPPPQTVLATGVEGDGTAAAAVDASDKSQARTAGALGWVIGFPREAEARTFIREWHRRPFPAKDGDGSKDDLAPLMDIQFLW